MKAKLTKWYKQVAATFTCPHCDEYHDVDIGSRFPEMPSSIYETVECLSCKRIIEFDTEEIDYEW